MQRLAELGRGSRSRKRFWGGVTWLLGVRGGVLARLAMEQLDLSIPVVGPDFLWCYLCFLCFNKYDFAVHMLCCLNEINELVSQLCQ